MEAYDFGNSIFLPIRGSADYEIRIFDTFELVAFTVDWNQGGRGQSLLLKLLARRGSIRLRNDGSEFFGIIESFSNMGTARGKVLLLNDQSWPAWAIWSVQDV